MWGLDTLMFRVCGDGSDQHQGPKEALESLLSIDSALRLFGFPFGARGGSFLHRFHGLLG